MKRLDKCAPRFYDAYYERIGTDMTAFSYNSMMNMDMMMQMPMCMCVMMMCETI